MSASASHHPVAALADDIAAARTFADLAAARSWLKTCLAILPEERAALGAAIAQQEQSLIRRYTGRV